MHRELNKPIFVMGSPRSGTSILTWCLGQHPNLFPVPESNWMGEFAVNVAVSYQIGAARGDYSILSAMDIGESELFTALGRSIDDLIVQHRADLERKRKSRTDSSKVDTRWLEATSISAGPKTRWVDGTPEYSLHICALRKLFPGALFIHLIRNVRAVVRSMVNFHRVAGFKLVANEEEAYRYWIRTVSACVTAERAYGPNVIRRIRHSDLADQAESTMRSLLEFLGEPYAAKCLEPLAQRINSSNVPADFKTDETTDPAIIEQATTLNHHLEQTPQPAHASCAAADELEEAFRARVRHSANLDSAYQKARRIIQRLNDSGLPSYVATGAAPEIADLCAAFLSQAP
jgi:Sulfotransferase family